MPFKRSRKASPALLQRADGQRRFFPVDKLLVPEVALEGAALVTVWSEHGTASETPAELDDSALGAFIALADASDERILSFARRWGLLGLCGKHRAPVAHEHPPASWEYPDLLHFSNDTAEPVAVWRQYATEFRVVLGIAAKLHEGKPASRSEWAAIKPRHMSSEQWEWFHSDELERQKHAVTAIVNQWIYASHVQPTLAWSQEPTIGLGVADGTSLLAALAVQIAIAIAGADYVMCSACRVLYTRRGRRRPPRGRNNYCEGCCDTAPARMGMARLRAERKESHGKARSS